MKREWLHKDDLSSIVVFCNGWGMDSTPFQRLESYNYDILNLFNFIDFTGREEVNRIIASYETKILIAWSMGVWAGQKLFADENISFSRTIAINGTLCPVDSRYGISRELFTATMKGWSENSKLKFYHRMCGSKALSEQFLRNQPARGVEDQRGELRFYLDCADCSDCSTSIYREAVIAEKDRIVPSENQRLYWPSAIVTKSEGGHFPFYAWKSWDELLGNVGEASRK